MCNTEDVVAAGACIRVSQRLKLSPCCRRHSAAAGACVRVERLAGIDAEEPEDVVPVVAAGAYIRVLSAAGSQPVAPLLGTQKPPGPASESSGLQGAMLRM